MRSAIKKYLPTLIGIVSGADIFVSTFPQGMSHIGLEEWERLEDIATLAEDHMRTGEMRDLKQIIARLLRNPSFSQGLMVDGTMGEEMHTHMRTLRPSNGEISS